MILPKGNKFLHAVPLKTHSSDGFTFRSVTLFCWDHNEKGLCTRNALLENLPHEVQLLYDVCLAAQEALDAAMRKAIEAEPKA